MSSPITLTRKRELALLATLAAIQFTHIVDFMIMMPLAPQLMRLWGIGPQAFGLLLSAYTFAAAASGLAAVLVVDRYDRRHALLFVYAGFAGATALCGIAPGYESLLGARLLAGAFGGVAGIVADGKTGFLTKPGDVKDFAAGLKRALASDLPALGRAARRKVERRHDIAAASETFARALGMLGVAP